jgi:hypothetical protein
MFFSESSLAPPIPDHSPLFFFSSGGGQFVLCGGSQFILGSSFRLNLDHSILRQFVHVDFPWGGV